MAAPGVEELVEWVKGPATLGEFMGRPIGEDVVVAYQRHARHLHPRLHMAGLSVRGAVLALRCNGGPEHVLSGMRPPGMAELQDDPGAWEMLIRLCSERGTRWVERLLVAAGDGDLDAYPLLARLVADHGLAEPRWFRIARLGRPDGVDPAPESGDQVLWYRHVLGALRGLPEEKRAESVAAVIESSTSHSSWTPWYLGRWTVPLLARIGATAEQTLWRVREYPVMDETAGSPEYREAFLTAVGTRGRHFAAEIVAVAASDPLVLRGGIDLVELLVVHHALPLPRSRHHWETWLRVCSTPGAGRRWQEQFLTACAVPNAMAPFTSPEECTAGIAEALAGLRTVEEIDDTALTDALLAVWERGDRVSSQRAVVQWARALGLVDRLRGERLRLLAALPVLEGAAAGFVVELLLTGRPTDAELAEIAVIVLPRGPKTLTRKVLDALGRLGSASGEVQESVALLAEGTDARVARTARELLARWAGRT